MVVADALGDLVHEVLVAGRHRGRGGVAAVVVDQRVGREHDGGAGLLDLRALEVVRDLARDVRAHVPHVEAVGAGLGGEVPQQCRHGRVGVAVLGLSLRRPAAGVDVELGAGEEIAVVGPRNAQRIGGVARVERVVVEDRDLRVVVGPEAVGPRAVEVGERGHRRRVHPLVDDAHVERVGALARGESDVVVGDRVEVDARLRVLALDPVADVLLPAEIARALDRDRQVALVLMRGVGRLIELNRSGAAAIVRGRGLRGGGDHESQPQAGEDKKGGSARKDAHGLRTRVR